MKYFIPVHDSFVYEEVPLKAIVELQEDSEVKGIEVKQLTGNERLMTIYRNIYRIEMKQIAGVDPGYFRKCISIAKDVPVYRIKREKGVMTVQQQISWLERTFLNQEIEVDA